MQERAYTSVHSNYAGDWLYITVCMFYTLGIVIHQASQSDGFSLC